jgi:hypothetical protein
MKGYAHRSEFQKRSRHFRNSIVPAAKMNELSECRRSRSAKKLALQSGAALTGRQKESGTVASALR